MPYPFSALLARMNYIDRWGLMRNSRRETLSEHTLATALAAHLLGVVAAERFREPVRPEKLAVAALYHDMSEIITGDMPTPVKYGSPSLRDEYKKVEQGAREQLLSLLPGPISGPVSAGASEQELSPRERRILKAADKLSALQKCLEEEGSGNTEFGSAAATTLDFLLREPLPEVLYYLENFLPGFLMTLDQLMQPCPSPLCQAGPGEERELLRLYGPAAPGSLREDLAAGRVYRLPDGGAVCVAAFAPPRPGEPLRALGRRAVIRDLLPGEGGAGALLRAALQLAGSGGAAEIELFLPGDCPEALELGFEPIGPGRYRL